MQRRLDKIESDLSSSWALQPREEYEKRVLGGMKNEINAYVAKAVAATFLFLGGAGYFLIQNMTIATYHQVAGAKYDNVVGVLEAELQQFKDQSEAADEWQALHNLGVFYRFAIGSGLFDIRQNDGKTAGEQENVIAKLIESARGQFESALEKNGTNSSTHWELGNLYYSIPAEKKLPGLVDREKALSHLKRAVRGYEQEQINQGYRADTYQRIARIHTEVCSKETDAAAKKQLLAEIQDCYQKAQADYEAMARSPGWVAEELQDIRSGLKEIGKNNCPKQSAGDV